jgi:hypothetical protein
MEIVGGSGLSDLPPDTRFSTHYDTFPDACQDELREIRRRGRFFSNIFDLGNISSKSRDSTGCSKGASRKRAEKKGVGIGDFMV